MASRGRARGRGRGAGSLKASAVSANGSAAQRQLGNSRPDVSAAQVLPTPVQVQGQFTDVQLESIQTVGQSDEITIKVSSLPLGTTTDEIGTYLESQGANVEVLSATNLGGGNAEVTTVGYTIEELEWLRKRKHKFKKQNIEINVVGTLLDKPLQSFKPLPLEFSTPDYELGDITPDVIEVTGFPSNDVDMELLELYFESPKSGGCTNAVVESSIIAAGIVHIKFQSQEVAARILSHENHTVHGCTLHLAHVRKPKDEPKETDKLLISNLPPGVDHDYLVLFLENVLEMEETDFSVGVFPDQLALITFCKDYTVKELEGMIAKIEKKPLKKAFVHVELCKMSKSIEISNISKHYDEEFLKMYFENHKKSGGGNVTSVELLGDGKALVAFEDPEVLKDVVAKNALTIFGENAVLKRRDPFRQLSRDPPAIKATSSIATVGDNAPHAQASLQPLNIQIDPLIAKCVQKNQESLAEQLQDLNIQQPEINEKEGVIIIIPTHQTISGWQQECRERITSYVHSNFAKIEIGFPSKAENHVRRCIMNIQEEATLAVIFNPNNTGFTAAGDYNIITMLETRTKEISSQYMQVQEDVPLKPEDYCYFTQVKAHQLKGAHPKLSIKYNPTDNVLHVRGSVQDVNCFRKLLPEYVQHTSISMQNIQHPLVVQYLSSGDGMQQLKKFIQSQKKDVQLATYFKQGPQNHLELSFLCDQANAESAEAIVRALQDATKEQVDQLPRSFTSLSQVDSGEYYQLCQSLEKQQHVQIVTCEAKLQVTIAGFSSGVTYSSQTIHQFIKEKCTLVKPVEIERGIWRLFCDPMQSHWGSIELHCKQKQVEVSIPDENATDPKIILKGDTELVEEMYQEIITLKKSVATKIIPLSRPGTCRYFKEDENAKLMLSGIEKDQKVCIEVEEVDKTESDGEDFAQARDLPQFTKVCVARTKEFKQITIYTGDITEFNKADVLVNAANADLNHVGGVAKAIADKGGPIIQEESSRYVRSRGTLADGEVWLTRKVGNLPCKALIHAVGPRWKGGGAKEEAHLSKACLQSLKQACKYHSIALPAISSGVYGFPLIQCADVLVKTVVEYSKMNPLTELQEISFILFKDSDAQVFADAIKNHLPADNVVSEKHHTALSIPSASAVHKTSQKKSKKSSKHIPVHDCIQVHKGSLLTVKADVYVNTTNTNLNLTQGAVAQTLAKAAGPSLQAECTGKAPISVGNIAVTKAGNLPSQHIIHVVAPSYDGPEGQAEKVLQNLIQKCMRECTRLKVSSVAFPALGAGNLRFPSSVVAKIMVGEISNFLAANKNTSLTSVHLVIYMKDTYQAFQQEIASGKSVYSPASPQMSSKTKPKHSSRSVPTRSHGATPEYAPPGGNIAITLGNITVQIIHGDISDDSSDVIVNTTNPELQLSGPGVSGALLRKGGRELQQLCDTVRMQGSRLESGNVLVTSASGKLKCKKIFHTIFDDLPKFVKTMIVCLQKAEEQKFKSIAFPAVGTGTHAHPAEGVAKAMIKAIQQFASSKHTHVTCVNLVLFDTEVYQTFVKVLQEPSQPGLWTRTKDWIGSLMWSQSASDHDDESVVNNPSASSASYEEINRELEFKIYGVTTSSVQHAEKKLFKLIEGQFIDDKIDDPNVGKLPHSDIAKLKEMSKQLHVEIDINGPPLNYIRLKGDRAELQQLKIYILKVLSSFEKRESQQREAQHLQKIVQWKWQDSLQGTLENYDTQENYEIEQACLSGQSTYTHKSDPDHYTIDFKKMEERNHSNGCTYTVVRVDLEKQYREGDHPQSWDPMPRDASSGKEEPVCLVDLLQGSEEYKKVLTEFNKTMNPGKIAPSRARAIQHGHLLQSGGIATAAIPFSTGLGYGGTTYSKIEKIQRVQNPMLYSQYQAKKKEMNKQNPQGHKNEWLLWHGTQSSTCQKINTQGFNRSFAGHNATVYGRGVYFARDASYSARDTYSPRDQNGYKYIYLVRVLVGECTVGNSSMLVPPPKDPSKNPDILFDSVVDNTSNPQVFVVFHDANAYPEYLVVFS